MKSKGVKYDAVLKSVKDTSPFKNLLSPGDRLVSINGRRIADGARCVNCDRAAERVSIGIAVIDNKGCSRPGRLAVGVHLGCTLGYRHLTAAVVTVVYIRPPTFADLMKELDGLLSAASESPFQLVFRAAIHPDDESAAASLLSPNYRFERCVLQHQAREWLVAALLPCPASSACCLSLRW